MSWTASEIPRAEGLRGTVAMLQGATFQHLATGEVMLGSQAQPGAEVFLIGPPAPSSANLGEDGWRDGITDGVDGDEVDPRHTQDRHTGVYLQKSMRVYAHGLLNAIGSNGINKLRRTRKVKIGKGIKPLLRAA
jgi:hypothetical protein